ncbi:translocase of the outer mitochondrial membrane 6 [Tasmannia lanceolata]|uniref:translocase of the outer mitochondrial membrane 6 n=1 Tax=Tasmannia lanceolata TaxID=3420 RepID=UPI0040630E5E
MFLGQIPRRPDKATAYKQLKTHLMIMGVWVSIIRITPYVLHYLTNEPEQLKLEF